MIFEIAENLWYADSNCVDYTVDLFNSDALTSAHKAHVFQLRVYTYTTASAVCLRNNIGLVSLILLG